MFGADVERLRPHLRPTKELASVYPCPSGAGDGCPRHVHAGENGFFEAACGNVPPECDRIQLRKSELAVLRLDRTEALAPLVEEVRAREYLAPAGVEPFDAFLPIGRLERQAGTALVVLTTSSHAHKRAAALELNRRANTDKVVVLVSGPWQDQSSLDGVVELEVGPNEDPGLWRASKRLWPESWEKRGVDPEEIFEDVSLEIGTSDERHVVKLNGAHIQAFDRSDIKLARLLLLAAQRIYDTDVKNGGWLKKTPFLELDDKEEDLVALRTAFLRDLPDDFAKLTTVERKGLIATSKKRAGYIRLALHPRRIRLDESLRGLRLCGNEEDAAAPDPVPKSRKKTVRKPTRGSAALKKAQELARKRVERILDAARKLGAPVPTTAELRRS